MFGRSAREMVQTILCVPELEEPSEICGEILVDGKMVQARLRGRQLVIDEASIRKIQSVVLIDENECLVIFEEERETIRLRRLPAQWNDALSVFVDKDQPDDERYRGGGGSRSFALTDAELCEMLEEPGHESWYAALSEDGRRYYYSSNGNVTWDSPWGAENENYEDLMEFGRSCPFLDPKIMETLETKLPGVIETSEDPSFVRARLAAAAVECKQRIPFQLFDVIFVDDLRDLRGMDLKEYRKLLLRHLRALDPLKTRRAVKAFPRRTIIGMAKLGIPLHSVLKRIMALFFTPVMGESLIQRYARQSLLGPYTQQSSSEEYREKCKRIVDSYGHPDYVSLVTELYPAALEPFANTLRLHPDLIDALFDQAYRLLLIDGDDFTKLKKLDHELGRAMELAMSVAHKLALSHPITFCKLFEWISVLPNDGVLAGNAEVDRDAPLAFVRVEESDNLLRFGFVKVGKNVYAKSGSHPRHITAFKLSTNDGTSRHFEVHDDDEWVSAGATLPSRLRQRRSEPLVSLLYKRSNEDEEQTAMSVNQLAAFLRKSGFTTVV